MFVSVPAKAPGTVGALARGTHGRLGVERLFHLIGLPLHHPHGHGFVQKLIVLVCAASIHRNADIGGRPGCGRVRVADSAHVLRLKIPLALFANGQAVVGEFDI